MINRPIKILITADFLLQGAWGLIGPIFAIFITQQISGGSVAMVGFIAAAYWLVKSIAEPFIGRFFDIQKGEEDDFKFLIGGMIISNLIPLGYLFSTQLWHLFFLEFIRGLAMAFVVPAWFGIFTRHIGPGWEAFSWSIRSTALGFAAGLAAAFGGLVAAILGFKIIFVMVAIFGLISTFVLFFLRPQLFKKE